MKRTMKTMRNGLQTLLMLALIFGFGNAWADQIADANSVELDQRDLERPARAALFLAPGFPTVDASAINPGSLNRALSGLPVDQLTSVGELRQKLRLKTYDVLILPYGSAFPLDAWIELRFFLRGGGGLVVLGGAPFHQPVRVVTEGDGKEGYVLGVRQPTYADELLIGPYDLWERADGQALTTQTVAESLWTQAFPEADRVFELTVRLGSRSDSPLDHGSEAYRDAVLRPLVHVVDEKGIPRACPLLEIDRLRGSDAGARWVLAPTDAPLSTGIIRAMVERALEGPSQLFAQPIYASIEPGETPRIRVMQRRPRSRPGEEVPKSADIVVRRVADQGEDGPEIFRGRIEFTGQPEARFGLLNLHSDDDTCDDIHCEAWSSGLYQVEVSTPDAPWHPRTTSTGFWVRDDALLKSGQPVTVSRDWLRVGGTVLPVVGATYMASDIHRKFLFEPNPALWSRDFALMREVGVNFVRTGLWTAWHRIMLNPGTIDEAFLRALDAYVMSAARNGIYLNFSFFAFQPPAYGGTHPYLDPRSLDGQKDLLTLIASRFRDVHWIHWDLINEPSYAPVGRLWTNLPVNDEIERKAWLAWIRKRHGNDQVLLRDRWQDRDRYFQDLPSGDDMNYAMVRQGRSPRKARDFAIFSQEVATDWAQELRDHLRAVSGDLLVTLGQDEGGTWQRPSQQFHGLAIDYTGVHPWWQVDDMLVTGVQTKIPEKPNLYQETGLMRLEDLDGWHWRTPEHAARALERKYAYSFASRGAGAINWAWNINPNMAIDNESVIGFFRPDGTAKPELRVITRFANFFRKAIPYLDDYEPSEVVAVIPHSRLFMNRPAANDGFRRLVRVMAERLGVVPQGLSELRLTPERLSTAKLILVPSPEVLDGEAAEALLAASKAGALVVITGAVLGDPYGEIPEALAKLGVVDPGRPLALRESTSWSADNDQAWTTFDRGLRENLRRSNKASTSREGRIWHEPLPLDHAREDDPLVALLEAALDSAGVATHPSETGVAARLLSGPRSHLAILVNEGGDDLRRVMSIEGREVTIHVEAGRSSMVLFERGSGRVLAQTPGSDPQK